MICYASNTQGKRNLAALHDANWRILIGPDRRHCNPPKGFRYAIDNGAWPCFVNKLPFDSAGFESVIEQHGGSADFIVIPDIVAGGNESLEFSKLWIDRLKHFKLILLAVQDGMKAATVGAILRRNSNMGIFLGGSTEWKLRNLYAWGMVAQSLGCYYHVGRVNSVRRIRLCQEAGAKSVDGTSATRYSCTIPKLEAARRQPSLLRPEIGRSIRIDTWN